jgi:sporulation and spore germination protein/immunoglobulin-like protein involved in spore germination
MTTQHRHLGVVALVVVATLIAACGPTVGDAGTIPPAPGTPAASVDTGSPDPTPGPSDTPTVEPTDSPSGSPSEEPPSPTPTPTVAPTASPGGTTIVRAYFLLEDPAGDGPFLVPVLREVPQTKAVARAAMNALLEGPITKEANASPKIVTAVPDGVTLLNISIDNGVATVDLSREFESGGGSASVRGRLAQVVYTLTQFSNVMSVTILLDGQPVDEFGGAGVALDKPQTRVMYRDQVAPIFVDRPAWGAAQSSTAHITGLSNVFEATFRGRIMDANGKTLIDRMQMATCGSGCWGSFDFTLPYTVTKAQWGTLRVYDRSAKDGTPQDIRDYPVWLTPAG